jgi:uncharacterized protein with GYD domain
VWSEAQQPSVGTSREPDADHTKEIPMAKYLVEANYVGDGIKGLLKEGGTSRRAAVEAAAKTVGGSVDAFYYAFGETDAYVIIDMPDNVTSAALALTIAASGTVTLRTTALLTPEDIDQAVKKSPSYRPPGQ